MSSRVHQFELDHPGYARRGTGKRFGPEMPAPTMAVLQLTVLLFLAALLATATMLDVPASAFTRDPAAIAGINPLNGLVSRLGVMLWSATVSITWLTALLLQPGDDRGFFLYFGMFTALLLVDDALMVHDELLPHGLSLPEEPVYVLYASILLYGLLRYRGALRRRAVPPLTVAGICFALSAGIDILVESAADWVFWVEDGAKLLGIVNWCAGFVVLAVNALRDRHHSAGGAP